MSLSQLPGHGAANIKSPPLKNGVSGTDHMQEWGLRRLPEYMVQGAWVREAQATPQTLG